MSTLLLQAVGGAIGGLFGPVGAAIGTAAGAAAGYAIDTALINSTRHIEGARLSGARPLTAEEGTPMARVFGHARVSGAVIWATRFEETARTERQGGKGGPKVTTYSYFANVAIGLCEGPVAAIKRVWADGKELDLAGIEMRFYPGDEIQMPDPLIEAKQGAGLAPAYRGTAYVVFERLPLERFGNRIPQFQVEVIRPVGELERQMRAVCVIPGSTEHGYAPHIVTASPRKGETRDINRHVLYAGSDWEASIDELQAVCPNLEHVSLVVAWFGTDLRAAECRIRPGVVETEGGGESEAWSVAGMGRGDAGVHVVSRADGRPAYGGTPSDASVIAAIRDLKSRGLKVTLCPFILMDVPEGNALPDPWSDGAQPAYPWRGRITCHPAIGRPGTPDRGAQASVQVSDFVDNPEGYRRFVNHHANLAVAAGGVDAIVIGTEMRGLTRVRDGDGAFPFVAALRALAAEVRTVVGPGCAITYAADWSEYFGYHPQDGSGDVFFNLDPLWADADIDAVGIDNYMPLSDWRDADEANPDGNPDGQLQAADRAAFRRAIAGGEGFDWYYASEDDRRNRIRTPITDGVAGKPWVFRYKDLVSWWSNPHFERVGGAEAAQPTAWVPGSKPIWFLELGCPAVDKGATQPNVFPDPKSSESAVPWFSNGGRDDGEQRAFLQAHLEHWSSGPGANPLSPVTGEPMVDVARIFLWAWDARPFPAFPVATDVWGDGANWLSGHWLNGRLGAAPLAETAGEVLGTDVAITVADTVQGVIVSGPASPREVVEPLAAAFGWAASGMAADGGFLLRPEGVAATRIIDDGEVADLEGEALRDLTDAQESELPSEIVATWRDGLAGYRVATSHSRRLETGTRRQETTDLPVVSDASVIDGIADRMLARVRAHGRILRFSLPWRHAGLAPGDVFAFASEPAERWLVTRTDLAGALRVEAVPVMRRPPNSRRPRLPLQRSQATGDTAGVPDFLLLDLPLSAGADPQDRFMLACWSAPPRPQAVYVSPEASGFEFRTQALSNGVIGTLTAPLTGRFSGRLDRAAAVELAVPSGAFESVSETALLAGRNLLAVQAANGAWEVLQFMDAEEVSPGIWRLTGLLRGQGGTEDAMLAGASAGARAVLLNEAVVPAGLRAGEIGQPVQLRIGVAGRPFTDRYFETVEATGGLRALAPLSPVHLKAARTAGGGVSFSWTRRTRVNGDSWLGPDVPLGEEEERYAVRLLDGETVVHAAETAEPSLLLDAATAAALGLDQPGAQIGLEVAQIGFAVGEGIPARRTLSLP
ncbi:baseplate multidomain protein megatron [Oricola thermophila]|uniref:Glycoside hydrolase/phage tail family protein n=1 Tax=Oricola thermophila TaxID=2742145 RepID=A0A6N1VDM0_9HYPH|nr:glycoside hydrolase/phage tail family protein [Oricola thermophila]QKV18623.1 glycoside hydrolase/phage tail family protein [Oricola thermophila]